MKKEVSITEPQGSEARREKRTKFSATLIFLGLALPLLVLAQITISNPITYATFEELIDHLIDFLFWIALALFPLMIVIAGFYFVTAAGDLEKVKTAKNIILYTLIGFIIILLAKGLIAFFRQYLGI